MNARNLPAAAESSKRRVMPTVAKYRTMLSPTPTYREGQHGELIESVDWSINVSRYALIPEAECQRIIVEVNAASIPVSREIAARLAKMLCCTYPAREMADPEIFARMLTSVFEEVPEDIGLESVDRITKQCRFLPSRAEVYEMTSELMARRQHARSVAEQHLEVHEEVKRGRAAEQKRRAELEARSPYMRVIHRYQAKFVRPREVYKPAYHWGVGDYEWRQAVEGWVARFGVDKVEAWHQAVADMPEAPASIMAELEHMAGEAEKAGSEPR